ncbi:MAG: HAD family hydrolase [Agathobacter sp.]|nr:HAD family hydrolase [Agathobacter sp.]
MQVSVDLKYENYIFDLYGTLVDIHTEEGEKKLWKALAKFYRQHGAFYFAGGIRRGYHKYVDEELKQAEEIQVEKVFDKLFADRGVEANEALVLETCRFFRDTSTYHLRLYEWSLPILQKLKENGKKVYLLSNAQRSFTYHEMEMLDIVKYFDEIYISSDHGMKKPNPNFFKLLIEKEGLDVKECLFLGNDQTCDILGAQGVGMDTWYVHTNCSPEYKEDVKATYEFL